VRFALSSEQDELSRVVAIWAERAAKSAELRDVAAADVDVLERLWTEAAGYGWLAIGVPEEDGGSGGSLVDACLIAEQLASHLVPLPFVGNAILAAQAAALFGSAEQRDRIHAGLANGGERYAVVVDDALRWSPGITSGYAFEWLPGAVPLTVSGNDLRLLDPGRVEPADCQDHQRRVGRVAAGAADTTPDPELTQRFRAIAMVATAAALTGYMDGALRDALEHAKRRVQFGRSIASFQAIQHMCADMLIDLEASRTATYGAAWSVDNAEADAGLAAAAVAKAWAAPAAIRVCHAAIQIFGGMGFTWECNAHLYLRSAIMCGNSFDTETSALDLVVEPPASTERSEVAR
jgi:alkylation response protein AidB-like acyl-CoA dehydrogenase